MNYLADIYDALENGEDVEQAVYTALRRYFDSDPEHAAKMADKLSPQFIQLWGKAKNR